MTTYQDGIRVSISADARKKYEDDLRLTRVDRLYTEIKIGAAGGALLVIAGLVAKQLLGA
jgi:hypothetical protein